MLSEVSSANGTTVYTYDVNGSLTNKANEGKFSYQYGYDLRNRLATANVTRKEGTADVTITSSYAYNADGIRTRALQTINGITQNRYFLLDDGHTGYAQVFEETTELGGSIVRSYTIGDDVLCQTVAGVTSHLLYDGHGSTRQLADNNGAVTANYAYDAYGKMLGGNPGVTDGKTSATDLLYAGEQFDPGLQMEYLRARYYDQDNGRFNRLDPFEGNSEDPQSLHKYAYAHADPVNGIDPNGEMALGVFLSYITDFGARIFQISVATFEVKKTSEITKLLVSGLNGWYTGTMNEYFYAPRDISPQLAFAIGFIAGFVGGYLSFTQPTLGTWVESIIQEIGNIYCSESAELTLNGFLRFLASNLVAHFVTGGLASTQEEAIQGLVAWVISFDANLLIHLTVEGFTWFIQTLQPLSRNGI